MYRDLVFVAVGDCAVFLKQSSTGGDDLSCVGLLFVCKDTEDKRKHFADLNSFH